MTGHPSILAALGAALLFGASTPFAKQLAGDISPILLAGLLYLGSGIGLWVVRLIRDRGFAAPGLPARDWPWLLGAIASGGVLGPVLLMMGLAHTSAADASLLLNLESVLTAVLAWVVFRENADRRIVLGMLFIVAGGLLLAWPGHGDTQSSSTLGSLAVAGACLCWAVDNNLTRKVSAADAVFIAGTKGLVAGLTNFALAMALGATLPAWPRMAQAMSIGLAGYGVSLGNVRRGLVIVAALPSLSATLLPQALALFRNQYPDVRVQLRDGIASEIVEMVRAGHADFAVGALGSAQHALKFTVVMKDRMHLVCRAGHPLSSLGEVPWRALIDYPFVAMNAGSSVRYITDSAFAELGVVKVPDQEVSQLTTMFGLAKAGLAVTAMPAAVMRAFDVEGVVKLPLVDPVVERELGFIVRRGHLLSPAAEALMELVRQVSETALVV